MAGFRWVGSLDGSEPIIRNFPVKNAAVLSRGEMVNLESGEVDAGASNDAAFLGVATEDVDNTADGLYCDVIVNPGAIYAVDDSTQRTTGAQLDLASGGMGLTTDSNHDFVVYKSDGEETQVIFFGNHAFGWA